MDTPTTALMDAMDSMRVAKTIAERRNHYNTAIRALGEIINGIGEKDRTIKAAREHVAETIAIAKSGYPEDVMHNVIERLEGLVKP
jgi:uncharacterized protein YpuA (DUF1002 family)